MTPPSPNTPGSLLRAVSEPGTGYLDLSRLLALTGLRTRDLAALAGVDADVLSRDPAALNHRKRPIWSSGCWKAPWR